MNECGVMGSITLSDDGTMDTVFSCDVCGAELRYSEVERDAAGDPTDAAFRQAEDDHAEDVAQR